MVGGTTHNSELSTIYSYDPEEDIWNLLDAKMKEGKRKVIAMMVDVQMFEKIQDASEPKEKRRKEHYYDHLARNFVGI